MHIYEAMKHFDIPQNTSQSLFLLILKINRYDIFIYYKGSSPRAVTLSGCWTLEPDTLEIHHSKPQSIPIIGNAFQNEQTPSKLEH